MLLECWEFHACQWRATWRSLKIAVISVRLPHLRLVLRTYTGSPDFSLHLLSISLSCTFSIHFEFPECFPNKHQHSHTLSSLCVVRLNDSNRATTTLDNELVGYVPSTRVYLYFWNPLRRYLKGSQYLPLQLPTMLRKHRPFLEFLSDHWDRVTGKWVSSMSSSVFQ